MSTLEVFYKFYGTNLIGQLEWESAFYPWLQKKSDPDCPVVSRELLYHTPLTDEMLKEFIRYAYHNALESIGNGNISDAFGYWFPLTTFTQKIRERS
jgi:hypothetical protein